MNAEGKSRAKAYTYAGGSICGIANTDRPSDHASRRAARSVSFFSAPNPMTSDSIETDEEPCPLDSQRLDRFLTEEFHVMSG